MPKAILEFSLPEEEPEYMLASNAGRLVSVLYELRNHVRGQLKYTEMSEPVREKLQKILDIISENTYVDLLDS